MQAKAGLKLQSDQAKGSASSAAKTYSQTSDVDEITFGDKMRYGGTQAAIRAKALEKQQRAEAIARQQQLSSAAAAVRRPISFIPDPRLLQHTVVTCDGAAIPLVSLWKSRRIVLAFTRDFGCLFCKQMFSLLAAAEKNLGQQAAVVVIGFGSVTAAHAIVKQTGFAGEVTSPAAACELLRLLRPPSLPPNRCTWNAKTPASSRIVSRSCCACPAPMPSKTTNAPLPLTIASPPCSRMTRPRLGGLYSRSRRWAACLFLVRVIPAIFLFGQSSWGRSRTCRRCWCGARCRRLVFACCGVVHFCFLFLSNACVPSGCSDWIHPRRRCIHVPVLQLLGAAAYHGTRALRWQCNVHKHCYLIRIRLTPRSSRRSQAAASPACCFSSLRCASAPALTRPSKLPHLSSADSHHCRCSCSLLDGPRAPLPRPCSVCVCRCLRVGS